MPFVVLYLAFVNKLYSFRGFCNFQPVICLRAAWLWCLCLELSGCYSSLTKSDQNPPSFFFFSFYIWRVETGCEFIMWLCKVTSLDLILSLLHPDLCNADMPRYSSAWILAVCCPPGNSTLSVKI